MTARALLTVAWVAGGVATAGLILLWPALFLTGGIVSAVATLVWGYLTEPATEISHDEWKTGSAA